MESSQNTAGTPGSGGGGGNGMIISYSNDASPVESTATVNAASTPVDDPKTQLDQVLTSIDRILGTLHTLYLNVSCFNVASHLLLLQRLNQLVSELENLSKSAEKVNIQVPVEILNLIDNGKNPDEFTRDVLNNCISKNQITKGKTDAFKALRKHLLEELDQAFPDEVEAFREIRASSSSEIKRFGQAQSMLPNGDVKVKTEN